MIMSSLCGHRSFSIVSSDSWHFFFFKNILALLVHLPFNVKLRYFVAEEEDVCDVQVGAGVSAYHVG